MDAIIDTANISKYHEYLDESLLVGWTKCAEYLIEKHDCYQLNVGHKSIENGTYNEHLFKIKTQKSDTSKIPNTAQSVDIVEWAGVVMGLLITQLIRPWKFFKVEKRGGGYDYCYIPLDSDNNEYEYIEMTATETPNGAKNRLNNKIEKFSEKFPGKLGYISVTCFPDKLQFFWAQKNDTN